MNAVTKLSDDEQLFQKEVAAFAKNQIQPYVLEMDKNQKIRENLIQQFFEMGLMGIEIPEEFGGSSGSFFMSCLAIEEISKIDPAVAVVMDV